MLKRIFVRLQAALNIDPLKPAKGQVELKAPGRPKIIVKKNRCLFEYLWKWPQFIAAIEYATAPLVFSPTS